MKVSEILCCVREVGNRSEGIDRRRVRELTTSLSVQKYVMRRDAERKNPKLHARLKVKVLQESRDKV